MVNKYVTSRFTNNSSEEDDKSGLATFSVKGNMVHLEITNDEFFKLSKLLDILVSTVAHSTLEVIRDDLVYKVNNSIAEYKI